MYKQLGGKKKYHKLLPDIGNAVDIYNTAQDITHYETKDLSQYGDDADEDLADKLRGSHKNMLDRQNSWKTADYGGLIGDNDDLALKEMREYDKKQRDKLENNMKETALVDMRKMKKSDFPGLELMSNIANMMGALKKKHKRKKKNKTRKKQKNKKSKRKRLKIKKNKMTKKSKK